jgi:hypothetical protein
VAVDRPPRLDLTRPRVYGELLSTSLQIFKAHVDVLLTLAIVLVAPVTLAVDGVWGGLLADGPDARPSTASQGVSAALSVFVVLPLVTAAGALLVKGLGRGEAPPDLRSALRVAVAAFPRVLAAEILYAAAVLVGLVLVIIPGIWIGIRCYFAAQAAALDGRSPVDAMRASADVVRGMWWRTFGCLILTGLMLGFTAEVAVAILGATGSGALYVAGRIVFQSIAVAITAVFATLLYYDLGARHDRRAAVEGTADRMAP